MKKREFDIILWYHHFMKSLSFWLLVAVLVVIGVIFAGRLVGEPAAEAPGTPVIISGEANMKITSSVFENNGIIPAKYTCDGENISPPLQISGVPAGAKSLALIMDDPDVPKNLRPDGMFDHWVVWNIPANTSVILEGVVPTGAVGKNTGGDARYTGPCPPDREHRYFFKLYVLDTMLSLAAGASKADLEKAMEGRVLAKAELMGRYARK